MQLHMIAWPHGDSEQQRSDAEMVAHLQAHLPASVWEQFVSTVHEDVPHCLEV